MMILLPEGVSKPSEVKNLLRLRALVASARLTGRDRYGIVGEKNQSANWFPCTIGRATSSLIPWLVARLFIAKLFHPAVPCA